jgi:hypothetical protein
LGSHIDHSITKTIILQQQQQQQQQQQKQQQTIFQRFAGRRWP